MTIKWNIEEILYLPGYGLLKECLMCFEKKLILSDNSLVFIYIYIFYKCLKFLTN